MRNRKWMPVMGMAAFLLTAGSVHAMTYAFESEGRVICVPDGGEYARQGKDSGTDLKNWYREQLKEQTAYLEKFGVTYDETENALFYDEKKIRVLIDQEPEGYRSVKMPSGEIDLYVIRDGNYRAAGVRAASQEEFDEHTRRMEEKKEETSLNAEYGAGCEVTQEGTALSEATDTEAADYAGIVGLQKDDEAVEEATDTEAASYAGTAGLEQNDVVLEVMDMAAAGYAGMAGLKQDDEAVEEATDTEVVSYAGTAGLEQDDAALEETTDAEGAAEEKRTSEYEKAGLSKNDHGGWTYRGKEVSWLVDENGGIFMSNTVKEKKDRVYVIVKRDEKGGIKEVKEVTLEEALGYYIANN